MATGYTLGVNDGTLDFKGFVMQCARAFGALIELRDEPLNAPIPEKLSESTYHQNGLRNAQDELDKLEKMTPHGTETLGKKARKAAIARAKERIAETLATRKRLEDMIAQVQAWNPPSSDHSGLKSFMLEQLTSTLDYDGSTKYADDDLAKAEASTPKDYWDAEVARAKWSIDYHIKGAAEEKERYSGKNLWVKQLRDSLK